MRLILELLALLIDNLFGDPPNAYHPVAWMGSVISKMQTRAPKNDPQKELAYGGLIVLGGGVLAAGAGWLFTQVIRFLPRPLRWLAEASILKMMLSVGGLSRAATEIQNALDAKNLPEARRLTSWHLVSRDTSELTESQVAAATIESVTENTSDSIVAPLFYYTLLGLPGAFLYRFANTSDAMLGYRDKKREWLGKIPARWDDFLNLIPARITALLFIFVGWLQGNDAKRAANIWWRDRNKTESPNAGHPMSAGAGALGIELEKVDLYKLGEGQPAPQAKDIEGSVHLMQATAFIAALLFGTFSLLRRKKRA
ncbi:MAG: cobalamin biosynthesis protein CobD [Chloroflexi bacterium]|nr:cobalamin biosynthesis protein CobD [Chloroflexota bacterium]